jgi:NADH-quinone oxidoreductase subunit G
LRLEDWQDAAIRNLAQDERSPLHFIAGAATRLDDIAASITTLAPADQACMARNIADILASGESPTPTSASTASDGDKATNNDSSAARVSRICADLAAARKPLIICGSGSHNAALIDAAADIARALCDGEREGMLSYCLAECNTLGSALLTGTDNPDLEQLTASAERGELDTLLVLENNLYRRASAELVERLFGAVPTVIGLDSLEQATLSHCDLVFPATAFTESEGTLVSSEGRAQRYFPLIDMSIDKTGTERRQPWQWLLALAPAFDSPLYNLKHFDEICQACAASAPVFGAIAAAAPDHEFRSRGLKIPRQPHRYSGRTAMRANVSVHEPKQAVDSESPLAYSMEGSSSSPGNQPASLLPFVWSPGWNSNQSLHKFQDEVGGPLLGGSAGVRLLDAPMNISSPEPVTVKAFEPRPGQWQLIACHRIYGSEELSARTPAIAELAGDPFVELREDDAAALEVEAGDGVTVLGIDLEVRINNSLPTGCAGYSAGFANSGELLGGKWVGLQKAAGWMRRTPQVIGSDRGDSA